MFTRSRFSWFRVFEYSGFKLKYATSGGVPERQPKIGRQQQLCDALGLIGKAFRAFWV